MREPPRANDEADRAAGRIPSTVRSSWTDVESLFAEVVRVVAVTTDTNPTELDPLYETFDPDALTDLFKKPCGDARRTPEVTLSFRYADCDITVHSNGTIMARSQSSDKQ